MFLSFDHLKFRYEPFPIGLAKPVMDDGTYQECLKNYPPREIFEDYGEMGKPGNKLTLSEKENPKKYLDFINSNPLWKEFHGWIKSDDFVYKVLDTLREHYIDLGYYYAPPARRLFHRIKDHLSMRSTQRSERLRARFEFSALPVDGGAVVPHTDAPTKIATLVVSMAGDGEWNPEFGGGTDLNRPKNDKLRFNHLNRLADFEEMEVLETFEFTPNQAVVFVRTFNSWHSVRPMTGVGSPLFRKTLTIVIEAGV
jgi:hypothetical protein